jgi:hypothetical protein
VHERADDFFGVVHVHLAAEGFQVKGLVPRHDFKYNAWSFWLGLAVTSCRRFERANEMRLGDIGPCYAG